VDEGNAMRRQGNLLTRSIGQPHFSSPKMEKRAITPALRDFYPHGDNDNTIHACI
jgi:hypothetical protein